MCSHAVDLFLFLAGLRQLCIAVRPMRHAAWTRHIRLRKVTRTTRLERKQRPPHLPGCAVRAPLVETVGAVSCADIVNGGGKWPAPNSKSIGVTVRRRTGLTAHICVCHSGREYRNTHVQRKRDPCWLLRPTCKPGTAQCMLHMRKSPAAQCWCMPCHVGWLPYTCHSCTAYPRRTDCSAAHAAAGSTVRARRVPPSPGSCASGRTRPAPHGILTATQITHRTGRCQQSLAVGCDHAGGVCGAVNNGCQRPQNDA